MKVLVIGREPHNFVCPLFKKLREEYGYTVDLFPTLPKDISHTCAQTAFNQILNINLALNSYNKSFVLQSVFSFYFLKKLIQLKSIKGAVRQSVLYKRLKPFISGYDVVHIFFMTRELFDFYDAITSCKKVVVSFWGSDLFQNNIDFDYDKQKKLLASAQNITVHHKEMREMALAKFGRELAPKVKEMLIATDSGFLNKFIDAIPQKEELKKSFKQRHNINQDKIVVAIGHSGSLYDMHLDITASIGEQPQEILDKVCLVFPMTYNLDDKQYANDVQALCDSVGVQGVILTEYLTKDELVELRLAAEVLLRISETDAFSLALCETLCAQNIAVTSSWLPYSKLRTNGVYYEEVYDVTNVGDKLAHIVTNFKTCMARCVDNPENVLKVFAKETSAATLNEIYTTPNSD